MTLGEEIYRHRKNNNMSQDDLANELNVSRQSVSKWEIDTSVPELSKLLRLSKVFNISLDELVQGEKLEEAKDKRQIPGMNVERLGLPTRKIVGLIVLGIGIIALLFLTLLAGLLFAFVFCSPLFVCAAICLIVKRYPSLWCGWALYALVYAYLRYATGIRFWWIFNRWLYRSGLETHAIIAWAMSLVLTALIVVSGHLFYKTQKDRSEHYTS